MLGSVCYKLSFDGNRCFDVITCSLTQSTNSFWLSFNTLYMVFFPTPKVKLPPCEATFRQHVLRVSLQVYIWTSSSITQPPVKSPLKIGWVNKNGLMYWSCCKRHFLDRDRVPYMRGFVQNNHNLLNTKLSPYKYIVNPVRNLMTFVHQNKQAQVHLNFSCNNSNTYAHFYRRQ
jgi:hypothetical protein